MSKIFKYIEKILQDVDGMPSSKRIVVLTLTILFFAVTIGRVYYGLKIDDLVYTSIRDMVCTGLGFTGLEKFTSRGTNTDDSTTADVKAGN